MAHDADVVAVRRAVRQAVTDRDPRASGPLVVACSGGADSTALLHAAVAEAARAGRGGTERPRVVGATVDHGLQPGSADVAAAVVERMAAAGADETLTARVDVVADGHGPEAAAREARYAVLEQVAASLDAAAVLLGHTLDDQAETVLLGLARGSGGRSLAGMRPAFGSFVRPLLDVRRAQTRAYCAAEDLPTWEDPHNEDPRYTRVRVRDRVLPLLEEELGPGVAETLARTAAQLRADVAALDGYADEALAGARTGEGALRLDALAPLPGAVRTRVLRSAALLAGSPASELFHVHVTALHALVTGALRGVVRLPGHLTASVEGDLLRFTPTPAG